MNALLAARGHAAPPPELTKRRGIGRRNICSGKGFGSTDILWDFWR